MYHSNSELNITNKRVISLFTLSNILTTLLILKLTTASVLHDYANNDGTTANLTTLKMVHIIFRHGERNPMQLYGNDLYNNLSYWPEGLGHITERGKFQSLQLGEFIRERYSNFLSFNYNQKEVSLQSSETNRTILSAQAVLAGLYGQSLAINENSKHHNFTIIPASEDKTIRISKKCSRYSRQLYFDFFLHSDVMRKFNEDFSDIYATINKHTGMNITYMSKDLLQFADTAIIKKERNYRLPSWTEDISKQLKFFLRFKYVSLVYTKEMKRLRAGPLLKEVLGNMRTETHNEQINSKESMKRKMFLYSGHDITIGDMLISFGAFDKIPSLPYSSAVFIELHQLPNTNKFFVELFFKSNSSTKKLVKLEMQNCEYFCGIDRFVENLGDLIPNNWEEECLLVENNTSSFGISIKPPIADYLILLLGIQGVAVYLNKLFKF